MAKSIRYAIAALFFAASVGCLALWFTNAHVDGRLSAFIYSLECEVNSGSVFVWVSDEPRNSRLTFGERSPKAWWEDLYREARSFGWGWFLDFYPSFYCPLWYPALVFALAGIASLRFRRQFSIRLALIGLAVVAALLGMVVAF